MNHLGDNMYSLVIKLDFCNIILIGELKALRWDDIKSDYIYVHAFMNEKNDIKRINPDSEYLFIKDSRPLATVILTAGLRYAVRNSALNTVLLIKFVFLPLPYFIRMVQLPQSYKKCLAIRLLP